MELIEKYDFIRYAAIILSALPEATLAGSWLNDDSSSVSIEIKIKAYGEEVRISIFKHEESRLHVGIGIGKEFKSREPEEKEMQDIMEFIKGVNSQLLSFSHKLTTEGKTKDACIISAIRYRLYFYFKLE